MGIETNSPTGAGFQMLVTRRYTFKLYPTNAQEAALNEQAVLLARLWNAALEQRETQWAHECQRKAKGDRKGISRFDQQKELKFIRRDDPAYAAMSSASLELTLEALDLAFKAFFRRAKGGAGASSGYPRYKRADMHGTIPHRDGSGWKISPAGKHWKIYAKGIPGVIKARGKFPIETTEIRTMELIRRDGAWWSSIVVKMEARLVSGRTPVEVNFDLIDVFASVKNRSSGECLSGLTPVFKAGEGRKPSENQTISQRSAIDSVETGGDDRVRNSEDLRSTAIDSVETGGDDRSWRWSQARPHDVGTVQADGGDRYSSAHSRNVRSAGTANTEGDDRLNVCHFRRRLDVGTVESPDEMQSNRDRRFKKFSNRWRREKARIAKRKAREARQRREALHLWTTMIIRQASDLLVVAPPIKDSTKSAKGDERNPGAAVATVAVLNRHVLSQAPAAAIQMLEYKAAEAGIQFTRITPDEHAIQIGRDLPAATKAARRARRELRKEAA